MNPLSKFTKPSKPKPTVVMQQVAGTTELTTEYIPSPEKCFCKLCKIHWTHPKAFVSACRVPSLGRDIVWLCMSCFYATSRKQPITEVSPKLQAPYSEAAKPPQPEAPRPKLPFKKLTK